MVSLYRIDPGNSRITVQAFSGGLLAYLGHNPTFAVREYEGMVSWGPETPGRSWLKMTITATSLELVDRVSQADRTEMERRMHQEVLETAHYPDIQCVVDAIGTTPIDSEKCRLQLGGHLTIRGREANLDVEAELHHYVDGIRLTGAFPLALSDYSIRPVTALAGAIHLKDELRVSFDIAAWREP